MPSVSLQQWRTDRMLGLPSQADLQRWRNSCDGLATSVDGIMYNELQRILATAPWVP